MEYEVQIEDRVVMAIRMAVKATGAGSRGSSKPSCRFMEGLILLVTNVIIVIYGAATKNQWSLSASNSGGSGAGSILPTYNI